MRRPSATLEAAQETDARADIMFESYVTTLSVEASTLIDMVETGILPACSEDMATYGEVLALAGERMEATSCDASGLRLAASDSRGGAVASWGRRGSRVEGPCRQVVTPHTQGLAGENKKKARDQRSL